MCGTACMSEDQDNFVEPILGVPCLLRSSVFPCRAISHSSSPTPFLSICSLSINSARVRQWHAREFILYWSYQQFKNIQLLVSQNTVGPDSIAQWNWLAQARSIPHRTSIPQKYGKGSTSIFPYTHCIYSISIQEQLKSWAASVYMSSKGSRVSLKMLMVPAPRRPRHRIQRSSKTQVDRKLKVSLSNIRFCLKPLHHSLTATQHRGSMPSLASALPGMGLNAYATMPSFLLIFNIQSFFTNLYTHKQITFSGHLYLLPTTGK